MILAVSSKISPKIQIFGQSGPKNCIFLFIVCSKFVPKSIHQIVRFQLQKYKIFQLLRGDVPPSDNPLCPQAHQITLQKISKIYLRPWPNLSYWFNIWTKKKKKYRQTETNRANLSSIAILDTENSNCKLHGTYVHKISLFMAPRTATVMAISTLKEILYKYWLLWGAWLKL